MVVISQDGLKFFPLEHWALMPVPYSELDDVEPDMAEKFKRENLWWAIVALSIYGDAYVLGGYDTREKCEKQLHDIRKLAAKGVKHVQLNESYELDEEDKFDAEKALRRVLLF